jgi:hypothetical protein
MKKTTIGLIALFLSSGAGFFFWYHQYVMVFTRNQLYSYTQPEAESAVVEKPFYFWQQNKDIVEYEKLVWSSQPELVLANSAKRWVSVAFREGVIVEPVKVIHTALSKNNQAFLVFDRPLMNDQWSVQKKIMIVESFLKTLRTHIPSSQQIFFFLHTQPYVDEHLFFNHEWPVQGYSSVSIPERRQARKQIEQAHILIDPWFETQTGRTVHDEYERTIIKYFCKELINECKKRNPTISITLLDLPSDADNHERLTHINRLKPDLYLVLHAFEQNKRSLPHVACYYYSRNPWQDGWLIKKANTFISLHDAYLQSFDVNVSYAQQLQDGLSVKLKDRWTVDKPLGIPLKSLWGIAVPSLYIEFGLPTCAETSEILSILVEELATLLRHSHEA